MFAPARIDAWRAATVVTLLALLRSVVGCCPERELLIMVSMTQY